MEKKSGQLVIAIDGYSSCGKSTLSKQLASSLDLLFIDTGAMYRAVALYAFENGIVNAKNEINTKLLEQEIDNIDISFDITKSIQNPIIQLNGKDVSAAIRSTTINGIVSKVASNKFVRRKMVDIQRNLAKKMNVVLDGRDIGTVVFPNATIKFFLTASDSVRAERRFKELKATDANFSGTLEEVKANLLERDFLDTTRQESPLKQADDAIVIDNTDLTLKEQLAYALQKIEEVYKSN